MDLRYLDPARAARAAEIPGCRCFNGRWRIPPDCAVLLDEHAPSVDTVLAAAGIEALEATGVWNRLWSAQRDDVHFALARHGALLGHPTAAGKTASGLAFAAAVRAARPGPVLVVVPALARATWRKAAADWLSVELQELHGLTVRPVAEPVDYLLITYECFTAQWGRALARYDWVAVVLDEAHELRGRRTRRVQGLRSALTMSTPYVLALTATPQWSRVDGLWHLLDLIRPGWFGAFGTFTRRYAGAVEGFWGGWEIGRATHADELRSRLAWTVRRLEKAQLRPGLPPLTRLLHTVTSARAAARLEAAARSAAVQLAAAEPGAVVRGLASALQRETACKLPVLRQLLEGLPMDTRVFVATQTRNAIALALPVVLELWQGADIVHGGVTIDRRMRVIADALSSGAPIIGTMQSVQQSIDCSGFDVVVILELPPTAEELVQFEGRFHRGGGGGVEIRLIVVDNSIDSRYASLCIDKLVDRGALLGLDPLDAGLLDVLRGADTAEQVRRLGL